MKKLAFILAALLMCVFFASAEEDPSVIAVYDGGTVTFEEVFPDFETAAAVYAALYGSDVAERADLMIELQTRLINDVIKEKLLMSWAEAQGVPLLSGEEMYEIRELAKRDYQLLYEESLPIYLADEALSEEEARNELAGDLIEAGLDYESYLAEYTASRRRDAALRLLAGDVSITRAQVNAEYDALLASDTAYYTQYPEDYTYACFYGERTALYVPAGLRQIRVYLIDLPAESVEALIIAKDTRELMRHAVSSESLYGVPGSEKGAPVCANCSLFDEAVIDAALALENPGDFSEPMRVNGGFTVVEYLYNLKSSTVQLKTVYEEIYDMLYAQKQQALGEEKLDEMLAKANVRYFLYRLG